jgi:hypothetical protein
MRIEDEEFESLKRQISAIQEIDGWFPLISELIEFLESIPGNSDTKVLFLQVFINGTFELMRQKVFDQSELSQSIEAFKKTCYASLKNSLIDFSDRIINNPVRYTESLITSIHKFKRKKILEDLGGEKLSGWEELILRFYTNEIENIKTISTLKPFVIETKNKVHNRNYNGEETQLEGYSKKRWALVLWYENLGSGIPASNYYRDDYMNMWNDPIQRAKIDIEMKKGMNDKIGHYRWAVNHIQNPVGKVEAQTVLKDLEKQLIEIKNRKK